jgi:hypothetical protein
LQLASAYYLQGAFLESSLLIVNSLFLIFLFTITIIFVTFKDKKYGVIHIVTIYFSLSIIDVFIPSILWTIYGYEDKPPWLDPLTNTELSWGILYYSTFYIIMFLIMMIVAKANQARWLNSFKENNYYIKSRINFFLLITGSIFLLSLFNEIYAYGGFGEWLYNKFTIRFNPTVRDRSFQEMFLKIIPWRSLFNALVFLAFFYRYKFNKPKLYGVFLPLVGVIFALSTSYRGSILVFLLGLFFMENIRIYIHKKEKYTSLFGIGKESINKPKYYFFTILIVISFLTYGVIRGAYVNKVLYQESNKESVVYKVLSQGSGIQGVSSIMRRYGKDLDFLKGKTYFEMLLLPIPRAIYTSKPEWYGIDDITTGMGWPASTQSAVTIPGEAYANFGWFGLFMAVLYGISFGLFLRYIINKGGIYIVLYGNIIIPVIFVSNWMAFTGIMNMFFPTVFLLCMIYFINVKFSKRRV